MSDELQIIVDNILAARKTGSKAKAQGQGLAPSNIALCKYWGKRNTRINLPLTSSLSISLASLGSKTLVEQATGPEDEIYLGGEKLKGDASFVKRMKSFLDLFRPSKEFYFKVQTVNDLPTGAGLASSASGFASLVLALDDFFQYGLDRSKLSILARLGSGSACRSLWHGFVEWEAGVDPMGMDSYAHPLSAVWENLCVGLVIVESLPKAISSREAMERTVQTSALYRGWEECVKHDLALIKAAIETKDFSLLGRVAEGNAMMMHATMQNAVPPIQYSTDQTFAVRRKVVRCREDGVPVYFTQDAGANLKLLFQAKDKSAILEKFGNIPIVSPFKDL